MKRTFDIEVSKNDEPVIVNLRLNLKGQENLENRYKGENILQIVYGALNNASKMAAVLKEALNYTGNTNSIKDGSELYDLIVDADMGGVSGFYKIMSGIARASGLLTEEEMNITNQNGEKMVKEAFESPNGENLSA